MDADERLRLDYEQTAQLLRGLQDVRFKLLALVPTVAGAAVGVLGRPRPAEELLGVGVVGLLATLGIFLYELRNSELHRALVRRARHLEWLLGLPSARGASGPGGAFSEEPPPATRLAGFMTAAHRRGLALVYGAALGGWAYLTAWGALAAFELETAQDAGAVVGGLTLVAVFLEVERLDRRRDRGRAASPQPEAG